ncbi:UDP-N-acetylglucosamine pyrophosphorylase /glucosamine-1-phosphate N-acetyltransferase [Bacillus oleivorans]|uniref:Bifunctional protein GlmU n=1 Tax=Bacillus oleivorans TaxID=1448271 RepID=A0A285D8P7_9BACI|nr:bifunctional UDP-N-acetylglucosamine diphosphorylase/glucosamine-1-phosphate N-acetyltransferase GlmU [Bacillus oleivorans]SNX75706.1 UDP-N-acetylglucosamine pyrophosphorylase /glucosamine-1-phosphate N-acetyltransferase [Bacillus oleivorans]
MDRFAIILAAGKGTRMKSKVYKVLHPVCGKAMVQHVIDEVSKLQVQSIYTIIGYGAEEVKAQVGDVTNYILQEEQLGTGHAVMQAQGELAGKQGTTIVLCGDTPLLTSETLQALMKQHEEENAAVTVLTAKADDPAGYGRVLRNQDGSVKKIVEHKDATEDERTVQEINTGTYCFDNALLFHALSQVSNDNAQGEYYLPDCIEILKQEGHKVSAYQTEDFNETMGVNDRVALSQAEAIMRERINRTHMLNGVSIIDPANTYIDATVKIGQDTVIQPGSILRGNTQVGEDCIIGPHTEITNCKVGDRNHIRQSVLSESEVGNEVQIGPFAHIRPESMIHDKVKVGNFVEIKKTVFGEGSKASHLSYIGDAEVGKDVNLGCGSITVNYDGKRKYLTKIDDHVFVGCNSNLVAPVTIGKGAYIAAGSTITDDVPGDALSIARARQVNKENYVSKLNMNNE